MPFLWLEMKLRGASGASAGHKYSCRCTTRIFTRVTGIQAGARAFVLKSDTNKMLMAAVESLMIHRPFYAGAFSGELEEYPGRAATASRCLLEKTIVKLVAEAQQYRPSARSGSQHKNDGDAPGRCHARLNINSTAGLVRYAVRARLVEA